MKNLYRTIVILMALMFASGQAFAWDVTAKVTLIEPSYMPNMVLFRLDASSSTCPAGSWVYYYGTAYVAPNGVTDPLKNVQAIYAGLLTSLSSGKKVEVHGDTGCVAINVHPTSW